MFWSSCWCHAMNIYETKKKKSSYARTHTRLHGSQVKSDVEPSAVDEPHVKVKQGTTLWCLCCLRVTYALLRNVTDNWGYCEMHCSYSLAIPWLHLTIDQARRVMTGREHVSSFSCFFSCHSRSENPIQGIQGGKIPSLLNTAWFVSWHVFVFCPFGFPLRHDTSRMSLNVWHIAPQDQWGKKRRVECVIQYF